MTSAKYLEKRLTDCLRQVESTLAVAERLTAHIRRLIAQIEDEDQKEAYRRHLRQLQSVVLSCESEADALRKLIRKVRGDAPKRPKSLAPPPPPTTIRVFVPKGLQIPDETIKRLVLQTLNGYAKETET